MINDGNGLGRNCCKLQRFSAVTLQIVCTLVTSLFGFVVFSGSQRFANKFYDSPGLPCDAAGPQASSSSHVPNLHGTTTELHGVARSFRPLLTNARLSGKSRGGRFSQLERRLHTRPSKKCNVFPGTRRPAAARLCRPWCRQHVTYDSPCGSDVMYDQSRIPQRGAPDTQV